ncbi:hypothetical protein Thiosp_04592 [Thiorhodovibrio litoralis]|nr:hypothetical protein Thiosp_04592 [Thiorhodovibrio litoralis]
MVCPNFNPVELLPEIRHAFDDKPLFWGLLLNHSRDPDNDQERLVRALFSRRRPVTSIVITGLVGCDQSLLPDLTARHARKSDAPVPS